MLIHIRVIASMVTRRGRKRLARRRLSAENEVRGKYVCLQSANQKGLNSTLFKWCRQFYVMYPQIGATVSHEFVMKPELLVDNLSF